MVIYVVFISELGEDDLQDLISRTRRKRTATAGGVEHEQINSPSLSSARLCSWNSIFLQEKVLGCGIYSTV